MWLGKSRGSHDLYIFIPVVAATKHLFKNYLFLADNLLSYSMMMSGIQINDLHNNNNNNTWLFVMSWFIGYST